MLHIIFWRGSNCHILPFCSQRQPKPAPPCSPDACSAGNHSTGISAIQRLLGFCRKCTILQDLHDFAVCGWKVLSVWPLIFSGGCILLWQGTLSSFSGLFLKSDKTRMEKYNFIPLPEHGNFCWSSVWISLHALSNAKWSCGVGVGSGDCCDNKGRQTSLWGPHINTFIQILIFTLLTGL